MLTAIAPPRKRPATFGYQPALDGLRAVAVGMVLLFHQGWLGGGYVGVSVFFTLSGYLITSLAIAERDRTGRFDVRAFYGRRVRRLLPASLACLAAIVVLVPFGVFDGVEHLRRDLFGALAQVYNWVALTGNQSYADLVAAGDGAASPVEHFWSLAIEEQFYWVWPLVLVGVLRRGRRRRVRIVALMTAVAAVVAPVIATVAGPDAAYWATPARLGEILVGALVAVVLGGRRHDLPVPSSMAWIGVAGLAVIVWAAVTWPSGSGPAYEGWLPAFALASAAVIVGLQVRSPLRRALAIAPLVRLGVISYGVYLIHWPVYVVLSSDRTGLASAPLFVVRMVVTLSLAALSYRLLERPIRTGRRSAGPAAAIAACALVAVAIALLPIDTTPYWMRRSAAASSATLAPVDSVEDLQAFPTTAATITPVTAAPVTAPAASPAATAAPTTVEPTVVETTVVATTVVETTVTVPVVPALPSGLARPVRIIVAGDSTAEATGNGMVAWAADHPDVARAATVAVPGCGFIRAGIVPTDEDDGFRAGCEDFHDDELPDALASLQPDAIVGIVTMRDVEDRVWDEAEGPLGPTDDRFYARLVEDYDVATQQFLAAGVTDVLWVLAPIPAVMFTGDAAAVLDPVRYARYAAAMAEVAARHPGQAAVIDLAGWLAQQTVAPERPDGLHWSPDAAKTVAADFLGPIVVNAALT